MTAAYADLARYYDLENSDFTEDLDLWMRLAREYGDPILEVGCGTGRVLLNLARAGYHMTGIDNSPDMLARLEAKRSSSAFMRISTGRGVRVRVKVVRAEMTEFDIQSLFKLAIIPYNTFMHLLTPADQLAALACIRRHLKPGGGLAVDMSNPGEAYAAHEQGLTLERTFEDGRRTVQQFSSIVVDRAAQLARVTWLYDSVGPDGAVQRTLVPLTLRYTFPGEMRLLLEKSGFALAHMYGDYERAPFADGCPRMIAVATAV